MARLTKENNFEAKYPEIAKEWDYTKNDTTPDNIFSSDVTDRYWICSKCGYRWHSTVKSRTINKRGCKKGGYEKVSKKVRAYKVEHNGSLHAYNTDILEEWDYDKNFVNPQEIGAKSKALVWWRCSICKGSYSARVGDRIGKGSGCPYCVGRKVLIGYNDLNTLMVAADVSIALEAFEIYKIFYRNK